MVLNNSPLHISHISYFRHLVNITGYSAKIPVQNERIRFIKRALKCMRREFKLYLFTEVYYATLVVRYSSSWSSLLTSWSRGLELKTVFNQHISSYCPNMTLYNAALKWIILWKHYTKSVLLDLYVKKKYFSQRVAERWFSRCFMNTESDLNEL